MTDKGDISLRIQLGDVMNKIQENKSIGCRRRHEETYDGNKIMNIKEKDIEQTIDFKDHQNEHKSIGHKRRHEVTNKINEHWKKDIEQTSKQ
ncbi:10622_t:CDS:2 [Entrophospora sp. SA101]|nr:8219_t:CDS:2 [Entrophospora sp. SA101]CAJ0839315.1 10622_t:CDS:2 [Entrophospora sp. SA101]